MNEIKKCAKSDGKLKVKLHRQQSRGQSNNYNMLKEIYKSAEEILQDPS